VAYSYRSKFLYTLGADASSDVYWDKHGQVDARIAYAFGDKAHSATIFVEGSNLNDEPWRTFVGQPPPGRERALWPDVQDGVAAELLGQGSRSSPSGGGGPEGRRGQRGKGRVAPSVTP
jgi:hypothetical protein